MKSESDFADPNALAKMAESTNDPSPERAFDIAWAIAVANEAHEAAHAACVARDRSGDYEVFACMSLTESSMLRLQSDLESRAASR